MKGFSSQLTFFMGSERRGRQNVLLLRFALMLLGLIALFSVLFHYIMLLEDQRHSWLTGLYWTLTVMSTLGFGDITFHTDLGRAFSIIVLLTGVLFLLVLLPFTVIQLFYAPWIEARTAARAPDTLPEETAGHVVLTRHDPITAALINRCRQYNIPYVLLVPDRPEALRLFDLGLRVMVGQLGDPETYRKARLKQAALLATTADDVTNAKVVFVAREVAPDLPLVATADSGRSEQVLRIAGATHVLLLSQLVGESLANRTIGGDAITHVIDAIDELKVAEANTLRTPLVGKTIAENRLGDLGVTVIGVWQRGVFSVARPETLIGDNAVILLGGTDEQLQNYDEAFAIYNVSGAPVVLVGGGRVGRATARALAERGIDWRMIERDERRRPPDATDEQFVLGDATDETVLKQAGIDRAPAVLLTPHDDAMCIYLTILLRHMRPDIQLISRAALEPNVRTLHRAGADFVMSTASLGASRIMNLLRHGSIVPIAEGLNIVRIPVPASLAGRTLAEAAVREKTGCTIIATVSKGQMAVNPPPTSPLPAQGDLLLIGDSQTEQRFIDVFGSPAAESGQPTPPKRPLVVER